MPEPILVAEAVRKVYRSGGADVCALSDVTETIEVHIGAAVHRDQRLAAHGTAREIGRAHV